jgi:gliding motility-associated lipoprotein GldD
MKMHNLFKSKIFFSILLVLFSLFTSTFISCNSTYTSKKKGYYKIDFPKREYVKFDQPGFPYSFEYPVYATIEEDSLLSNRNGHDPYSINIDFSSLNGKIYITYKVIGQTSVYQVKNTSGGYRDSTGKNIFQNLVNDCYNLTYKNDVKANSIEDSVMRTPNNITGIFFRLSGSVATAKQFFLSDTTHNFLRGALYFDATPNEDSLRPVNDFLQEDMKHIINTLKWI